MRFLAACAFALVFLAAIAFADVGPNIDTEPYALVSLNATYNGAPVPDDTAVEIICYVGGKESRVPTTTFGCEGGICNSSGFYKLAPCRHGGEAAFLFAGKSLGKSYTTPVINITGGKVAYFSVQLNPDGSSSITYTGARERGLCTPAFLLALLPLLALMRR